MPSGSLMILSWWFKKLLHFQSGWHITHLSVEQVSDLQCLLNEKWENLTLLWETSSDSEEEELAVEHNCGSISMQSNSIYTDDCLV